jgi:hypothetical protein
LRDLLQELFLTQLLPGCKLKVLESQPCLPQPPTAAACNCKILFDYPLSGLSNCY